MQIRTFQKLILALLLLMPNSIWAAEKKTPKKNSKQAIETPALDLSDPTPSRAPAPAHGGAPAVLDLSDVKTDPNAAKRELLLGPNTKSSSAGGIDFGGGSDIDFGEGVFDFGTDDALGIDLGDLSIRDAHRDRFEAAMALMSDEDYADAALEFAAIAGDAAYGDFVPEAEYQLAKALYQLGFYEASLHRFQVILGKGASHKRYRKSIEWLFFMSRKMADEMPVLAELARFRNVSFPKSYRNEYRYLLAKYLFVQAEKFETDRQEADALARSKQSKEAAIDFSAIAEAIEKSGDTQLDFSAAGASMGLDFSDSGASAEAGVLDFGGKSKAPSGGFDFGGGLDFGAGAANPKTSPSFAMPTVQKLPTNAAEAMRQALELIAEIDEASAFYPRAKYLEGLIYTLEGADQKAVAAFQETVRSINRRDDDEPDTKLREMAFLSLARLHYGYKQFNRSVYYYDLIGRDSESWLTALFEGTWAYYRRGDFDKALGNLITLHSPFFEKEYFPESQIVKAIIYFEACRYPETRAIVDEFLKRYTGVMNEVAKIAQSNVAPETLFQEVMQMQAQSELARTDVATRVMNLTLNDSQIRTASDVVEQVNEQNVMWSSMPAPFRDSALGAQMTQELRQADIRSMRQAGIVMKKKFEQEQYNLKSLLAQALRIKIEVARAERELLERRLRNEDTSDMIEPAIARTVVDDEHTYWPYEGEYWRDELGTYELDFSMCRAIATP